MADSCRVVDLDGTPVRVRGNGKPLTKKDRAALSDLVAAVRRRMAEEIAADPTILERQEAARARNHARLVRLGMAHE